MKAVLRPAQPARLAPAPMGRGRDRLRRRESCANAAPPTASATARTSAAAENFAIFAKVVARTAASSSSATAVGRPCAESPFVYGPVRLQWLREARRRVKSSARRDDFGAAIGAGADADLIASRDALDRGDDDRANPAVERGGDDRADGEDWVGAPSTIALGAVASRIASASTDDEEDEPRANGMTRMRPATLAPNCGWLGSRMRPVSASIPPQKLSGAESTSASPSASPRARPRAIRITARSSRPCPPRPRRRNRRVRRTRPSRRCWRARNRPICRNWSSPRRSDRAEWR